jgi:mutator protein MutT
MEQRQIFVAVALILNEAGEILLGKRNQPELPEIHGKWEFPGGGIDFGETPEQAVIREAKEETGLDVEIIRLLPKIYTNFWEREDKAEQVIILAYECKAVGGSLGSNDKEINGLKFIKREDIDYENSLPKTKEIIALLKS